MSLIIWSIRFWLWAMGACAILMVSDARAYPSNIGYGYTSCISCHYNPLGNGILTDYGRAVGATAIGARPFFVSSTTSDERLGETAGFLFGAELPKFIRLQANYRGMYAMSGLEGSTSGEARAISKRLIHMKADGSGVLQFKDGAFFITGSFGYAPRPNFIPATVAVPKLISREHYLGLRPTDKFGLYAGRMDVAFGIRVPDHIAYSRSKTALSHSDQLYGVMLHYGGDSFEAAAHPFAGNIFQAKENQQRGGSLMFEFDVVEKFRLGLSGLYSKSERRGRWMAAIHSRLGAGEGSAILSELGFINEKYGTQNAKLGSYIFFQALVRLVRGLHFMGTGEAYTERAFAPDTRYFRMGPGLQYFPMQRMELRVDFLAERTFATTPIYEDSLKLNSQLSVWF